MEEVAGEPGRFTVKIRRRQGAPSEVTVGAIVLATGWRPARAGEVRTLWARAISPTSSPRQSSRRWRRQGRSSGRPTGARPVAWRSSSATGAGDDAHLAYGGNVASLVALKQATYVRAQHADAVAYVFYEDMQTPGQYEYFYKNVQRDPGILLSRGQVARG